LRGLLPCGGRPLPRRRSSQYPPLVGRLPPIRRGRPGGATNPGRPPKLTPSQERIVRRWLAENPTDLGFPTELWTTDHLGQLIEEEWGISFHPHYLAAWLRQRDYTPQLPRRVAREANAVEIARWLAEDWPRIKRKARRRGACLMLLDESGLLMAPLRRRSWSLRGHPPQSKEKKGHREKVSIAGAIWLTPLRDRLTFAFQTLVNDYFSNEEVADFLSAGLQWLAEPLVVLWDRGTMHKGNPINQLMAQSKGDWTWNRCRPMPRSSIPWSKCGPG